MRDEPRPEDRDAVRAVVASTGFFHDFEIDVAVELVDERLRRGEASGYHFVFADAPSGRLLGYACYGPIACTEGSYDLFWIAVDESERGRGLGRRLLEEAAERIRARGGRGIYIETSGRAQYAPTRAFYERCGCMLDATLPDFYAPGDPKLVFRLPIRPRP